MKCPGFIGMLVVGAMAAVPAQAQVSDARIRELIKEAAERVSTQREQAVQAPAPGQQGQPVVRLTLDDAVKFALDRNLDIAVQRLTPEISDIAIAAIRTQYHPALTSTFTQAQTNGLPQHELA